MGGVLSKAADSTGAVFGNAVATPFKTIFGRSCELCRERCSGPWDVVWFIEHLCVTNPIKLLLICVHCYIGLLFLYLLFELGICQCIGRSLCNMCCVACETYWHPLGRICCFVWYKITSTSGYTVGDAASETSKQDIS